MDTLTTTERSERMSKVRAKNSRPELLVRRMIHNMGYRYRLHRRDLPGTPGLVFPARRKVIFIHGCFWHRHPDRGCKLARLPKSRHEFWIPKLEGNLIRDVAAQRRLLERGWQVMVVWECQLNDLEKLQVNVREFLEP